MKKKKFKQIENQAQDGRSMIEMLGVLALIGVLSVGSLSGYEYATASYRAGQIRDALLAAKKSASVNTNSSHANEVKRLLSGSLPLYGVSVVSNSEGQHKYQVKLTGVAPRTCAHLWEMKNVLDSFLITMTSPESKNGCQLNNTSIDTVPMSFEFNAFDHQILSGSGNPSSGCTRHTECGGGGYCQAGICVECRTSADCSGNQVCDEQAGRCTYDCSKGACKDGLYCINYRCGECSSDTRWNGKDCVPIQPETTTSYIPEVTSTTLPEITTSAPNCSEHGVWCGYFCSCTEIGWGGADCSQPGYCSNHGYWINYDGGTCSCNSGWEGDDCSRCANDSTCKCSGNGEWFGAASVCLCSNGWGGKDCSQTAKEACSGNGTWETTECKCTAVGWGGEDCSQSGYCNNHGRWYSYGGENGYCYECTDGFGGSGCTEANKCGQHGRWVIVSAYESYCFCKDGYGGLNCETFDAKDNLCNNHGSWDSANGKCSCNKDWTDKNCSTCTNTNNDICKCNGNGTWKTNPDGTGSCECRVGHGSDCQTCESWEMWDGQECICAPGFFGEECL